MLDVSVRFSDGTDTPLDLISPQDYFLDMTTLNNDAVNFLPRPHANSSHARDVIPEIEALGEDAGELLKVSLEMGDACRRRKSRIMAVSYVYVSVDFTPQQLQGDAARVTSDLRPAKDNDVTYKKSSGVARDMSGKRPITSLEVGIYVLLAVCCIAISVFLVNFAVFVRRYKLKLKQQPTPPAPPNRNSYAGSAFSATSTQRPHAEEVSASGSGFSFGFGSGGAARRKQVAQQVPASRNSVTNANDWVWIGRQTLQRNAIPTECARTLMPSDQFAHVNRAVSHLTAPPAAGDVMTSSQGAASNRSSSCIMGTSQLLGANNHAADAGNPPQKPQQSAAMYQGSECSIRITPNPLSVATAGATHASSTLPRPGHRNNTQRALPANNSFQPYDKPLPPTPVDTCSRTLPRRARPGEPFYANTTGERATPHYATPHKKPSASRCAFDAGMLSDIPSASGLSASSLDDVMDTRDRTSSPATHGACERTSSLSSASMT